MYAVIRADGRQQRVALGEIVRLGRRDAEIGEKVQLSDVLLVRQGDETLVGKPVLNDALIEAKVLRHGRGKKIRIYTYKKRKAEYRTKGHRQDFTEVRIERIALGGVDLQAEAAQEEAQPAAAEAEPVQGS
ncbi:MAG: 50S ribosomal protein L21 [Candidatus Sumerlaeota bacterium]|nr:50S ribosomal protein L21 [Candidatus Sumerlaeota bacterium]